MFHLICIIGVCLLGAGLPFVKRLLNPRCSAPLPPGPAGWPMIGNLFQMPYERNWENFAALGKKYGDISSISILRTRYVVLNSHRVISAVLEKQSAQCSDRPRPTVASDLYRELFHRSFGTRNNAAAFNSIEEEEIRRFLRNVLRTPDDLLNNIRSASGAIMLRVAYGHTVQDKNDSFVELADKVKAMVSLVAAPGASLVDFIPALRYLPRWFPGAGFLIDAKGYNQLLVESIVKPHQYVVEQMVAGTAAPSLSSTLLEGEVSPEGEELIMWASMTVYLAGTDTVVSAVHAFFLAMVLFPEVQAKAQAELDTVVGNERLPCVSDRDSLPYINAVCKEVLRWHSVAPLAMPHVASENIYYDGFLIPKGSYIIGNAWVILHDKTLYPKPDVFRPERFLGETPQFDPHIVCFGFGKRICPGYHLAEDSLFIAVAMTLAVFRISKKVVGGVEVTPRIDVGSGAISHPKPFACQITARSPIAEALLQS